MYRWNEDVQYQHYSSGVLVDLLDVAAKYNPTA